MQNTLYELSQWRSISALTLLALLLAWESLVPFFAHFTGSRGERVRHGLKNLALGVLNALLTGLGFAALWWTTAQWAQAHDFGLLNWLPMPVWARLAGAFLLFDAWMYGWHRLNHRIPFLWRFHRTHHSDPKMDVTTANRFHIGEIAKSDIRSVFAASIRNRLGVSCTTSAVMSMERSFPASKRARPGHGMHTELPQW